MQKAWRVVGWASAAGFSFTILFFWLMPPEKRGETLTLLGIGVSAVCAVGTVVAARQHFATWPGFIALLAGLIGAHLWLWWMWSLWESPVQLIRNLNTVIGLLAIDLLLVLIVDVALILIYRDSAPIFIGAVWVLYPLTLIGVALAAPDMDTFLASENLRAQVLWITPMTVLPCTCCLSLPAFLIHLSIVLVKEIRKK